MAAVEVDDYPPSLNLLIQNPSVVKENDHLQQQQQLFVMIQSKYHPAALIFQQHQ